MNSRDLVRRVFDGEEPEKPPFLFESEQKDVEHKLGDAIVLHAWVPDWGVFMTKGGPFAREGLDRFEWSKKLDIDEYEWLEPDDVVQSTLNRIDVKKYSKDRFVIFEVLGPTEQSEFFCMPPPPISFPPGMTYPSLSRHLFDFSALREIRPDKARALYDRIAKYTLELVKAGAEMGDVDAIRVADDLCSHVGPNYSREFIEEDYLRWHREFARVAKKNGKYSKLHSDGNLLVGGLMEKLADIYDAIHPLDFMPKPTLVDSLRWIDSIVEARALTDETVFFTGIPVEIMFRDEVSPNQIRGIVKKLLLKHGGRRLVLTDTHRPYPGRSFTEAGAMLKVRAIKEEVEAHGR
jgi:hypothetical protein